MTIIGSPPLALEEEKIQVLIVLQVQEIVQEWKSLS